MPAVYPVEYAICKLNPPVYASTSIISPAKYNPFINFDSIVEELISFISTPPAVIIASSIFAKSLIVNLLFYFPKYLIV